MGVLIDRIWRDEEFTQETGIIPKGTLVDFEQPHNRARLAA
jgi:hypothetical protein